MFLYKVANAFEKHHVHYALVGGYAVALHGAIRGTVDIDVVIQLTKKSFLQAEKALKSLGLESKLPVSATQVFEFREDYIKNRNLVAWSFYNPNKPIEVIDILITEDEKDLENTEIYSIESHTIRVASVNDLIRMKTACGRPQDLADVEALKILKNQNSKKSK